MLTSAEVDKMLEGGFVMLTEDLFEGVRRGTLVHVFIDFKRCSGMVLKVTKNYILVGNVHGSLKLENALKFDRKGRRLPYRGSNYNNWCIPKGI